ncbi:hypothetical protein I3J09_14605 [Streptomyces clavuligerus]|uniref:DNA polymerase III alpha subunit n=3 Tax=Streptomyces clavuligerus TaxID=1901 RepID=E2PVH7_STRCL|nr:hypothetical protein [Streptomyces clavuligerus]ANW19335.1 hypothetical protein BB341_14445 [Streptomyces clavuligerus]AXU13937.1 hypothetical protein D1794_15060 [Streptomyces clavuligerus]EFG07891.1 DNA polymerase III alpha subunit [Streptomyces clavuligerus]MBY6303907.1 hypothetical protein [Streptomyces clavuligerus]QCS06711.1 hypothetical protein CRV15_14410 [Streptomyces clavuligerus]
MPTGPAPGPAGRQVLHVHFHFRPPVPEDDGSGAYGRLLDLLREVTPRVQALPPADADCEVTGGPRAFDGDPGALARLIRTRALTFHGVVTSIGCAENRTLAAMAADAAGPGRTVLIPRHPEAVAGFLRPRPVTALPGVGPATARLLVHHGLRTVGAVADTPLPTLRRLLGAAEGQRLSERAHGVDHRPVSPGEPPAFRTAGHAFARDELDPGRRRRAVAALAERIGGRLRSDGRIAGRLTLTVRYADGSTTARDRALPEPSHSGPVLVSAACSLYESLGLQRARVRGLSLRAGELLPEAYAATQLGFDFPDGDGDGGGDGGEDGGGDEEGGGATVDGPADATGGGP